MNSLPKCNVSLSVVSVDTDTTAHNFVFEGAYVSRYVQIIGADRKEVVSIYLTQTAELDDRYSAIQVHSMNGGSFHLTMSGPVDFRYRAKLTDMYRINDTCDLLTFDIGDVEQPKSFFARMKRVMSSAWARANH